MSKAKKRQKTERKPFPKAVKVPFPYQKDEPNVVPPATMDRNAPPTELLPHYFSNDYGDHSGPMRCRRCGMHEEGLLGKDEYCSGWVDWAPPTQSCIHPHGFMGRPRVCSICGGSPITVEPPCQHTNGFVGEIGNEGHCVDCGASDRGQQWTNLGMTATGFVAAGEAIRLAGEAEQRSMYRGAVTAVPKPSRKQLEVLHLDGVYTYHGIGPDMPWKFDVPNKTLLIGKGVGRVMVPLDNVRYITLKEY